jgi:hypothetical protein
MTAADAHAADLGAIRTRYLLIDFDGPICSIYTRFDASGGASGSRMDREVQEQPLPVLG